MVAKDKEKVLYIKIDCVIVYSPNAVHKVKVKS